MRAIPAARGHRNQPPSKLGIRTTNQIAHIRNGQASY